MQMAWESEIQTLKVGKNNVLLPTDSDQKGVFRGGGAGGSLRHLLVVILIDVNIVWS